MNTSRLVTPNYSDRDATLLATRAPEVQQFFQLLIDSLAGSLSSLTAFIRGLRQTYIQSAAPLERNVSVCAPEELYLPEDTVLHVVEPLYIIPKSGLHWYLTYLDHHKQRLGMKRTTIDPGTR